MKPSLLSVISTFVSSLLWVLTCQMLVKPLTDVCADIAGEQKYFYMLKQTCKVYSIPIPGYDTSANIFVIMFRLSG